MSTKKRAEEILFIAEEARLAAECHITAGDFDSAKEKLTAALELLERSSEKAALMECLFLLAVVNDHLADDEGVEVPLKRALVIANDESKMPVLFGVRARSEYASYLISRGRYADAEPLLLDGIERIRAERANAHESEVANLVRHEADALRLLADVRFGVMALAEAEDSLMQALSHFENMDGPVSTDVARTLIRLGRVYTDQTNYIKAEQVYKRGLVMLERMLGKSHFEVGEAADEYAGLCYSTGDLEKAEILLKRALICFTVTAGRRHLRYAGCLMNVASLRLAQENNKGALESAREAYDIARQALEEGDPSLVSYLHTLADACRANGEMSEAEDLERRAQALQSGQTMQ